MLNYEKRLVVVTYCIHFEGLIQLDAEASIINKEISVAQAALVFTVFTLNEIFFIVRRHFLLIRSSNLIYLNFLTKNKLVLLIQLW